METDVLQVSEKRNPEAELWKAMEKPENRGQFGEQ